MNKSTFLTPLFVLIMVAACGEACNGNKFDSIEGRPALTVEDIQNDSLCPSEDRVRLKSGGSVSTKFGHTVVLVDTTSGFKKEQFVLMDKLIFGTEKLLETPPFDRLSILHLNGIKIQATENEYIFSRCRPRNNIGHSPHKLDQPQYLNIPAKMTQNWQWYLDGIDEAKVKLAVIQKGKFTQLLEQIKELSRMPHLLFDDRYTSRKLIIVSDLLQESDNLNFGKPCRKGKCKSWNKIKNDKNQKGWIKVQMPEFGGEALIIDGQDTEFNQGERVNYRDLVKKNKEVVDAGNKPAEFERLPPIEVEIIYLNSSKDPKLKIGLKEVWIDYFSDLAIENVHFEFETST